MTRQLRPPALRGDVCFRRAPFLALLLIFAVSCAGTPARKYHDASENFAAATESLTTLRKAGKIDDKHHALLSIPIHKADAILDRWHAHLKASDPETPYELSRGDYADLLDLFNELAIWSATFGDR